MDTGSSTSTLALALKYADNGWPVFPVATDGERAKTPAIWLPRREGKAHTFQPMEDKPNHCKVCEDPGIPPSQVIRFGHGFLSASTDTDEILEMWAEAKAKGVAQPAIGTPTGKRSGRFVLDVDVKDGKDGAASERALLDSLGLVDWPDTPKIGTWSGGWQYVFLYPQGDLDLRNTASKLGLNIDTRGEGGYTILPGSVVRGKPYTWLRGDMTTAPLPLPGALLDKLRPSDDRYVRPQQPPSQVTPELLAASRDEMWDCLRRQVKKIEASVHGERHVLVRDAGLVMSSWDHDGIIRHEPGNDETEAIIAELHTAIDAVGWDGDPKYDSKAALRDIRWGYDKGLENCRSGKEPWRWAEDRLTFLSISRVQRPVVTLTGDLMVDADAVIEGMLWVNQQTEYPFLYTHGDGEGEVERLVGLSATKDIVPVDKDSLAYRVASMVQVTVTRKGGALAPTNPTGAIVKTVFGQGPGRFPSVERRVCSPYFTASGAYVDTPGYDEESHCVYFPPPTFTPLEPNRAPSEAEALAARDFLQEHLLNGYEFETEGDRAAAWALPFLPLVRNMIPEQTPLWSVESASPSSGKSTLARSLMVPTLGARLLEMTAPSSEEEWEKKLLAACSRAPEAIMLDNVKDRLSSASLAHVLTNNTFTSRILGASEEKTVPVRNLWLVSANNPVYDHELLTRRLRIRLYPSGDAAELPYRKFAHTQPQHARMLRAELLQALTTIVFYWLSLGAPREAVNKRSFSDCLAILGGIVTSIGIEGWMSHDRTEQSDEEESWTRLVRTWNDDPTSRNRRLKTSEVRAISERCDFTVPGGTIRAQDTNFAAMLRRMADTVHDGYRIKRHPGRAYTTWWLEKVREAEVMDDKEMQ